MSSRIPVLGAAMAIPYLVLLLIVAAAAAAAASASAYRVDETAVHSRDCYAGNTLLPMQDSCCYSRRHIHRRKNVGVDKVQSPQNETEFTSTANSTAVQSPQTGVASSAVSDPYYVSTMGKLPRRSLKEDGSNPCAGCGDGAMPKASPAAAAPSKSPVGAPGSGAP